MMLTAHQLLLIGFCIVTEAARELCFRSAADGTPFLTTLRRPLTWAGIFFWTVELIAWVRVLETTPLTVAFPLAALVYVVTFLSGVLLLKEPFTARHCFAALLVTAGVACIGSTSI